MDVQLFKGGLLAFLADNLASNALGGFNFSFSMSFRYCRTCLVPVIISILVSSSRLTFNNAYFLVSQIQTDIS